MPTLRSRQVRSLCYRLPRSVGKPMRTLTPISNNSLSSATPSSSKEWPRMRLRLFPFSTRETEALVLFQERCCGQLGEVFNCVHHEVFPNGQNQYPSWKDLEFLAGNQWFNTRGMGETPWIHPGMSSPWDGQLAHQLKFLQWADIVGPLSYRCYC